jgi:PAS domain S-box-containing protein
MPKILVAAPESETRETLRQLFEQDGYTVLEAEDGEQCLDIAQQYAPDIVLLNSTLAAVDALTVCSKLHKKMGIPIMMISGETNIDAAFSVGASDIVTWPVRPKVLRHRTRHLLENQEITSLRQREAWYRSVIENAAEGIYRCTPEGDFIFVNPALINMLGYNTAEEVLSLNFEQDVEVNLDDPSAILATREFGNEGDSEEVIWRKKNGDSIIVRSYSRAVIDEDGRLAYYEGIALDITERKRAEAEERNQRLLAQALRDTATILNSTLNVEEVFDRILECVRRVLPSDVANIFLIEHGLAYSVRRSGYEPYGMDEVVRRKRLPVDKTANLRRMLKTGQPDIIADTHKDPNWVMMPGLEWVRAAIGAPIHEEGQIVGFLMVDSATPHVFKPFHAEALKVFADQAALAIRNARLYEASQRHGREMEQRVAERTAELEQQRAQLQAILDSMNEGVEGIIYAEDGRKYRFTNAALLRLIGYETDELQTITQVKPDDITESDFLATMQDIRDQVFATGLWKGDVRFKHKKGHIIELSATAARVSRPDGKATGLVVVLRDESRDKLLEAQKKRFVASAAHELRTPITNLNTRLFLLQRQPERMETHLEVVEKVASQLQNLVEDLLDLSRFEHGLIILELVQTELITFLKDIVLIQEAQAEAKAIRLTTQLPPASINISIDQARMSQVFSNLITNAIKFTGEGGAVIIRILTTEVNSGYAVIQVEDTGIGIAPEHLPLIFEPFYRAVPGAGLGLGLSIIKEIVELHGGKITVESEPGKGTCFSVWLKLADDAAMAAI